MTLDADAIVVGAGLAGLVATAELAAAGRRVILLDQEPYLGGQAFWSFGGLFLVDSPEQRRMGIRDSHDLALQDWLGSAGFDRPEDHWPRRWAEAYVQFAAGEERSWLRERGVRFFPLVGWAERGGYGPTGHGNSVPRFHITWGTGPGVVAPFEAAVRSAEQAGTVRLLLRHRVDELTMSGGAVHGVRGSVLAPAVIARGQPSSRDVAAGACTATAPSRARSSAAACSPAGPPGAARLECWRSDLGQQSALAHRDDLHECRFGGVLAPPNRHRSRAQRVAVTGRRH